MKIIRHKTRVIKIGRVKIGGDNPIAIQSMVKAKTSDIEKTIKQINELECLGCQIVRLAVKDIPDAKAIKEIKKGISVPIVADIHFDWRLALEALDSGADKIRLNPGNIYNREQIREIVAAAKLKRIPIRVGVNSGSLKSHPSLPLRAGKVTKSERKPPRRGQSHRSIADRMVESALDYIRILEKFKFYDIVISLKASNILDTIEAYRKIAGLCDYPLHLGVTATGLPRQGAIKSSIALGVLLLEGIGDTIRVSLTGMPQEEVKVAKYILGPLGLRSFGAEIISCPTCGRCEVDLIKIVNELEKKLSTVNCELSTRPPKVAVMGCVVNGPGEAKEADIGIAFGKRQGLLFKNGKAIKKVSCCGSVDLLLKEMEKSYG